MMLKLAKDKLSLFFERISKFAKIYVPDRENNSWSFIQLSDAKKFDTDYLNVTLPPRIFFLPKRETLLSYQITKNRFEIKDGFENIDNSPFVIFGMRPCDAIGLLLLKKVMLDIPEDAFFKKRVELSTIITLACQMSDEYCFCTSFNKGPVETEGSDLFFAFVDGYFYVKVITEKGEKLVKQSEVFESIDPSEEKKVESVLQEWSQKVKAKIDNVSELPQQLQFESPRWKEVSQVCIGCGVCTFLCPACYCFDIQDESILQKGERVRIWDSCQFYDFTKMPAAQPRLEHYRRARQRILHKFRYYPEIYKAILCTGCGRCSRKCPMGIDLLEQLEILRA